MLHTAIVATILTTAISAGPAWATPGSVFIEDLTWVEVHNDINAGKTTVIIPVGGTEQSGPHMALGKHNVRVKALAGKIASALGNTLVAPVVAYVPEGAINPPAGHMRYAGTISISDDAFRAVLSSAARSFRQHGFVHIVFIGDHGGYQSQLKEVAAHLNREWSATATRAHFVGDYYQAAEVDYVRALRAKGLTDDQIGTHAGVADTSLMLAIDAALVRPDAMPRDARAGKSVGVAGDPRASTAALGQLGVDLIVTKTVTAMRAVQAGQR